MVVFLLSSFMDALPIFKKYGIDTSSVRAYLGKFRTLRFEGGNIEAHPSEVANIVYWERRIPLVWLKDKRRFVISKDTLRKFIVSEYEDSVVLKFYTDKIPSIDRKSRRKLEVFFPNIHYPKYSFVEGDGFLKHVEISNLSYGVIFSVFTNENFIVSLRSRENLQRIVLKSPRSIGYIVIDPGHGGKDPGAIANGVMEKDVALGISLKLEKFLKDMGFNVVMTRRSDRFVSLRKRAEIAKKYDAFIFVSIHANYSRNKQAYGPETYFLSPARTNEERAVEMLENKVLEYEEEDGSIANMIVSDMLQNKFLEESQKLAFFVHKHLTRYSKDRKVRQAGFYVLRKIYAPSILVEVGYLTNRKEARRLMDESYQRKLAKAIAEGIKEYIEWYIGR